LVHQKINKKAAFGCLLLTELWYLREEVYKKTVTFCSPSIGGIEIGSKIGLYGPINSNKTPKPFTY